MSDRNGKPDLPCGSAELSAEQDAELRRLGAGIRSRSPLPGVELDSRVMARIRRSSRARLLALGSWCLRPRSVTMSPLRAFLGAAAVAVLLLIGLRPFGADRSKEIQSVQFVLAAPGASQVNLVGDFNGWDSAATPLKPVGAAGVWSVEVPLPAGRHEYAFVIDGHEWRSDPAAPLALSDDYGAPNSVITVGAHRL